MINFHEDSNIIVEENQQQQKSMIQRFHRWCGMKRDDRDSQHKHRKDSYKFQPKQKQKTNKTIFQIFPQFFSTTNNIVWKKKSRAANLFALSWI